jgi:hypothetical protein
MLLVDLVTIAARQRWAPPHMQRRHQLRRRGFIAELGSAGTRWQRVVAIRAFLIIVTLLSMNLRAAIAGSVPSYELPAFVSVGRLLINDSGELVVTFTERHDGKTESHFWNADIRQDLPDIDPTKIARDKEAYEAVIARNHLIPLELGIRGKMTLASGSIVSGEWLDTPGNCQWLYHSYVNIRPVDGAGKALAFLIRRPPHLQDLVHQCVGVSGASFLNVSFVDGSPLFYRRPGGGFYVVVQGTPYVIGFTDDGETDFSWDNKPLVMLREDLIAAAYTAMATGKLTPQGAVDNLHAAASALHGR